MSVKADLATHTMEPGSKYIIGPLYDSMFFIYSPLWALALGMLLGLTAVADPVFEVGSRPQSFLDIVSGVFTMSHLVIVFYRSHMNPSVFSLYPRRFILAPALLFLAMILSSWMLIFIFVLAVWWDVYHSALQTWGLGRIYDAKLNTDKNLSRSMDRLFNLAIYITPIFAGASLLDHVIHFESFRQVGSPGVSDMASIFFSYRNDFSGWVALLGALLLGMYVWRCRVYTKRGYRISRQKVALFVSTAICSVWAWGFNPMGQAFFIMNFFHALQYFALVLHTERASFAKVVLRSDDTNLRRMAMIGMAALGLAYGIWAHFWGQSSHLAMSLLLTVSIMHFWFDGFIWSVQKKQI